MRKRKTKNGNGILNSIFPCHRKTVGTKVHALFNLSGLSRAATGTNESLDDGGAEVTDCRRKRKQGKPVYCQHMLHYGISGHFQALPTVLKRCGLQKKEITKLLLLFLQFFFFFYTLLYR